MHEPGNAAALPTKVAVEAHCRSPWRPKRRGGGCHGVVRASPNHTRRGGELLELHKRTGPVNSMVGAI